MQNNYHQYGTREGYGVDGDPYPFNHNRPGLAIDETWNWFFANGSGYIHYRYGNDSNDVYKGPILARYGVTGWLSFDGSANGNIFYRPVIWN